MGDLAVVVMRIFATALDLREDFFDGKIDRHISRLRLRNYPEQPEPPRPGQLRAGTRTTGSLTILKAEANPGGLEVCNRAGDWVAVPIVPGTFVVNLGELMARWTNDRWPATLHRVVNPPRARGARQPAPVHRVLPQPELRRRDPLHPELRRRGPPRGVIRSRRQASTSSASSRGRRPRPTDRRGPQKGQTCRPGWAQSRYCTAPLSANRLSRLSENVMSLTTAA